MAIGGGGVCVGRGAGSGVGGDFVEENGSGLAEVHGGLARIGGDFDKHVAGGEVVAGEAVLFRAEDDGDAALLL